MKHLDEQPIQLLDCPKCKAKCGWSERRITYRTQHFNKDGFGDSSEADKEYGGKVKRCLNCNRIITKCIG